MNEEVETMNEVGYEAGYEAGYEVEASFSA